MKWYRDLYVGDSITDRKNKIKWKIMHNAGLVNYYVIAFAANRDNLLDIIPTWALMDRHFPKKELKIIGIARGYGEALEVTRRIIDETYRHTGGVDVWAYLKEERRKGACG
jgi:hypothetical protein